MKKLPSRSYRLAIWSFVFAVLFAGLGLVEELSWGGNTIKLRSADASLIFALLTPTLALYGFRRYTNARWGGDKGPMDEEDLKK